MFVESEGNGENLSDVTVGFFGALGPASTNRSLSFQGSLLRELGIASKLTSIRDGCFECTYALGGTEAAKRLSQRVSEGHFDSIAYRYRILFVRFLSVPQLDEVYFERDSLFR